MQEPNPNYGFKPLENVVFYVDWADETKTIQDGDALWSDGVTTDINSPSGNVGLSVRSILDISLITVPRGTSLSNYKIHFIEAQIYGGFSALAWSGTGWGYISGGYGCNALLRDNDEIAVNTGSVRVSGLPASTGSGLDIIGNISSGACRVRIVCSLK
jgi:hypothetical protein